MDKETILKKAREEEDEMVVQTHERAMRYTYIALVLCAAIFTYVRASKGQPMMDLCATVCFSIFAGRLYCFVKTKERFELSMAVITFLVAVGATIRFFMGH